MKIFRWMAVTFSLYSRIPVPRFEWREDDMAHSLMFFPLVGAVIGALIWVINVPSFMAEVPVAVRVMLTILVPIAVTGGFHLDGFMDTEDALRSYADRDKKLEILKDPHIGAFAVIGLVKLLLTVAAAVTVIVIKGDRDPGLFGAFGLIFVVGRCLSGLTSLSFKKARKSGMLYEETRKEQRSVKSVLILFLVAAPLAASRLNPVAGLTVIASFILSTAFYRFKIYREFDGVTGDTAGWYLSFSETLACVLLAIVMLVFG